MIVTNLFVAFYARRRVYGDIKNIPYNDFALVLGTSPLRKDGQSNRYFVWRMDAAAALFFEGKVGKFILSGDKHDAYDEPAAMRNALFERGVPRSACLLDGKGYDTIDSILHARKMFGATRITIVSQEFHCERAVFIAGCLGISAIAYSAEDVVPFWKSKTKVREIFARVKVIVDIVRLKLHLR